METAMLMFWRLITPLLPSVSLQSHGPAQSVCCVWNRCKVVYFYIHVLFHFNNNNNNNNNNYDLNDDNDDGAWTWRSQEKIIANWFDEGEMMLGANLLKLDLEDKDGNDDLVVDRTNCLWWENWPKRRWGNRPNWCWSVLGPIDDNAGLTIQRGKDIDSIDIREWSWRRVNYNINGCEESTHAKIFFLK